MLQYDSLYRMGPLRVNRSADSREELLSTQSLIVAVRMTLFAECEKSPIL